MFNTRQQTAPASFLWFRRVVTAAPLLLFSSFFCLLCLVPSVLPRWGLFRGSRFFFFYVLVLFKLRSTVCKFAIDLGAERTFLPFASIVSSRIRVAHTATPRASGFWSALGFVVKETNKRDKLACVVFEALLRRRWTKWNNGEPSLDQS